MSVPGKYLNQENIIKKVFDESNDSLRVTTNNGGTPISVSIDAADDSIAIGDRSTGDLMTVNPDGSTNVNIVGAPTANGRLPVDVGTATVNITGPVTIPGSVEISNDIGNPIPVTGTGTFDVNVTNSSIAVTGPITDLELRASPIPVSGTIAATQSGTWDINDISGTISLPTGASTLAEQQAQTTKLNTIDTSLDVLLSTRASEATLTSLDSKVIHIDTDNTTIISTVLASDAATESEQINQSTILSNIDTNIGNINANIIKADTDNVTIISSTLPTGAATSLLQTTGNSSLSSIDSKLTSPLTVQATNLDIRNLIFATDKVDISGSSISVSSSSLPSGAATAANQVTEIASLSSIDSKLTSPLSVTGPLTDTQLRTTAVPISGTVTSNIGTSGNLALDASVNSLLKPASTLSAVTTVGTITNPVASTQSGSWSVTANAGTNLNTSALNLETTQSAINTKLPATLGQKTMANSLAIVISNDQSVIPVTLPMVQTYSAATSGSAITTTTPQDVYTITGSGTKTIKIIKIGFSVTQTTASTNSISLIKRAANTGGTSTTIANIPYDSNNAAGTATVRQYTVNPSGVGAASGFFLTLRAFIGTTSNIFNNEYIWDFSNLNAQQRPTLRGTNETLAINFGGTTIAGANPSFYIIWTEE